MNASERITLLRFPLIVGIVFIHAYGTKVYMDGTAVGLAEASLSIQYVQEFISQTLARIAVPLFFAIAGYLFFLSFDGSRTTCTRKWRSRVRSLLIPYIVWNSIVIAALALGQTVPATADFFSGNNKPISAFGFGDYLNAYLGHGARKQPIAYPFWFIRDLMVLVLCTPLIYVLIKKARTATLVLSATAWLFVGYNHHLLLDPGAWLFFAVGAVFAFEPRCLERLESYGRTMVVAYLFLAPLDAWLSNELVLGHLVHKFGIVMGAGAAWYVAGRITRYAGIRSTLGALSAYAFFVFAAHEPLLTACKKVAYRMLTPESSFTVLIVYFGAPVFVLCVTLGIGALLRRTFPVCYGFLTGGRTPA